MKTLKIFLTFFVVMTFFALTSYSQGNSKTSYYYNSGALVSIQLPDVPETVSGSYEGYWTVWNFKTQWRAKGTYTGDISGTMYYTSVIENYSFKDWMPGSVETGTGTVHIRDEYGTVYYKSHYTSHVTVNANGEITSEVYNSH